MTGDTDPIYVAARRTMLDALEALSPLGLENFVMVGAHAVYVHAATTVGPIAPFTSDADLVVDPRSLRLPNVIQHSLAKAGFVLRGNHSGLYEAAMRDDELQRRVDIFVPEGLAHHFSGDGYARHDVDAVMVQEGLELALYDCSTHVVASLDADPRRFELAVAGPAALLVAKGWKIGEAFDQDRDSFDRVGKDISDIYRLLRATPIAVLGRAILALPPHAELRRITRRGAKYLRDMCRTNGPGAVLLADLLGWNQEANEIVLGLDALVNEFYELVEANTKPQ